jgi:outer membrane protein assembly factor BamB
MSRRWVIVVVAFAVLGAACDWAMFGYGPTHTRFSPDTSISPGDLPAKMQPAWTASVPEQGVFVSSPVAVHGVVYVGSTDHKLYAFDAAGLTNCSGTPTMCTPLWSADTGSNVIGAPAVVDGVVYVPAQDGALQAYDAAGVTGCSGAPKTCEPLWSAALKPGVLSSPTVASGIVYIATLGRVLYAFDAAAGSSNCSGTPKTCTPLWSATTTGGIESSPTVGGGIVFIGATDRSLYAFDAAGSGPSCAGTPKTCTPLWSATSASAIESTTALANGMLYVGSAGLSVYDAAGSSTTCSGTPKTCTPLWTAATGPVVGSSAVANGIVYVPGYNNTLYAFDAAGGSTTCSGTPKTCSPLWSAPVGGHIASSPALANGVIYIGSDDGNLYAFDAAGSSTTCSGTPKTCTSLWSTATGGPVRSSPAVADGFVYVVANNVLHAYVDDTTPPETRILAPTDGATLSGGTTLRETSFDNVIVSKVEFHLTGGTFNDAILGVATPTGHGGYFGWDTTSVPNGRYKLNSVAYDGVGNVGRSPDVHITVRN